MATVFKLDVSPEDYLKQCTELELLELSERLSKEPYYSILQSMKCELEGTIPESKSYIWHLRQAENQSL